MKSRLLPVIITAAVTSLATYYAANKLNEQKPYFAAHDGSSSSMAKYASYETGSTAKSMAVDFQPAAESSVKAVVHIKTQTKARTVASDDAFLRMFGMQQYMPSQVGSGSGVVISPDGYIVTNNHVVANTDKVTVTFNNRYTTEAKVISTDPQTDIAVLKVNEKNLSYMEFGNSDNVKLGQWVLAVGYPLTLDATVTAGIVSAKSRSLGINRTQTSSAIESFIQTDAAVNPGNSGGALVNTDGLLIGINSAIASPTGSYAGYSYAIPANLVRKVVNDIVQFGSVKRGYMGVVFIDRKDATPEQLSALGIDRTDGVYVDVVSANGGAAEAGIKKGDFITAVNGTTVHSVPELMEQVARYHPGDNINVSYLRNGTVKVANVQLKKEATSTLVLGANFRALTNDEKKKYGVENGVLVTDAGKGTLAKSGVKTNFVIVAINDVPVGSVDDMQKELATNQDIQISGFYPNYRGMYYYNLRNVNSGVDQE
ncbi:MAG: trypsin-like peptidase domain-containing protein [Bacteroidetes bacterium]|nr:trypsin-like peptidase domain-containing protein [Bacteroidota bacterium]